MKELRDLISTAVAKSLIKLQNMTDDEIQEEEEKRKAMTKQAFKEIAEAKAKEKRKRS